MYVCNSRQNIVFFYGFYQNNRKRLVTPIAEFDWKIVFTFKKGIFIKKKTRDDCSCKCMYLGRHKYSL